MGLVGPGFVGAHHIDAVRRLGFVDVVAIAASSEASARRKADALGVPKAYGSFEALVADPDVHVVHNTTPNYLHVAGDPGGARARQARRLRQAAGDERRRGPPAAATPRSKAGVVHAVTFNYRGNPLVQQAREMIARRRARPRAFHPRRLPAGLAARGRPTSPGASSRRRAAQSSAVGDIGSHWCDLVQHVTGQRIVEVLADLTTVIDTRLKPSASTEAFAQRGDAAARAVRHPQRGSRHASCCASTAARRAASRSGRSAPATRTACGSRSTAGEASLRWEQERQNELWIGRRDAANAVLAEGSVAAVAGGAAPTRTCRAAIRRRGPTRSATSCATSTAHRRRRGRREPRPPAFATFEDGYHSACVVDAILESHRRGGVWTEVA